MTIPIIETLLLQVLAPLVLMAWLLLSRAPSRAVWLLRAVTALSLLGLLALAGVWVILPRYVAWWWLVGTLVVLAVDAGNFRRLSWWGGSSPISALMVTRVCLALAALGVCLYALSGWYPRGAPVVDLAFPLRGGNFLVVNGGDNRLLDSHLKTLLPKPEYHAWRGQSYGVDLVAVNELGLTSRGFLARNPTHYVIFGLPVVAPCDGTVVRVENGLPDLPVPGRDPIHKAGNYVVLQCGNVQVVLAHLQEGSVKVVPGEAVSVGMPLARVGNSGNTGRPHLHIHVQRPGTQAEPFSGAPLFLRFDGDFPVRNEGFRRVAGTGGR